MNEFDVIVIGAGPGGYVCAIRAAQLGKKVAIVEKQFLGGICLNWGCIPTKTLLSNAALAHTLRERAKEFGVGFDNLTLDYAAAVKRSRTVSDRLVKGVGFLMKKNNITVFMGTAKLSDKNTVAVTTTDGKGETLKAKDIVIATGSHFASLPTVPVDGKQVITFWEALQQETLPKSALVIGAGAMGVEFATVWNSYGAAITLVEMLPRIVPLEDEDVSKELEKSFKKRGMEIYTGSKVYSVKPGKGSVSVVVDTPEGQKTIEVEQVLVATGFRPNTEDLGLKEAGVALTERGFVQVDDYCATNVPGIWAIGDVTGKLLLAHVASSMGIISAEKIAGLNPEPFDINLIPRATYSEPQVGSFGLSEAQAKEKGYQVKTGRFNFQANGKALGLGNYNGFVKVIVDAKYGEILGAAMIGDSVSELLPEFTLARRNELTIEEIAHNVHAHPTLSEAIQEAAEDALGRSIHQ
jgi:dihydrolipoamide dehydrogenase